jgi:hypothetical protein
LQTRANTLEAKVIDVINKFTCDGIEEMATHLKFETGVFRILAK